MRVRTAYPSAVMSVLVNALVYVAKIWYKELATAKRYLPKASGCEQSDVLGDNEKHLANECANGAFVGEVSVEGKNRRSSGSRSATAPALRLRAAFLFSTATAFLLASANLP